MYCEATLQPSIMQSITDTLHDPNHYYTPAILTNIVNMLVFL